MRRVVLVPMLVLAAVLGGCDDVTGIGGGRSVEGQWSGTVDREDIFLTLSEDDGRIHGSGSWGPDAITVDGTRSGSDVSLVFEFSDFDPANLQGEIANDRIEGWVTGSGYRDEPATLWRD
jgi:hypothetical protein